SRRARRAVNRDEGRCTPASLLFVADRLMDRGGDAEALGKIIRQEEAKNALPPSRIDHVMFTMSGNEPPDALSDDYQALDQKPRQLSVNRHIDDHQDLIAAVYEEASGLGGG